MKDDARHPAPAVESCQTKSHGLIERANVSTIITPTHIRCSRRVFDGVTPYAFKRFDGRVFDEVNYSILREEYESGSVSPRRRFS